MPTVYTEVEVDVDLTDFDTEDLIEELENRNAGHSLESGSIIRRIYEKRRMNRDYQQELDDLIYTVLGKIA